MVWYASSERLAECSVPCWPPIPFSSAGVLGPGWIYSFFLSAAAELRFSVVCVCCDCDKWHPAEPQQAVAVARSLSWSLTHRSNTNHCTTCTPPIGYRGWSQLLGLKYFIVEDVGLVQRFLRNSIRYVILTRSVKPELSIQNERKPLFFLDSD